MYHRRVHFNNFAIFTAPPLSVNNVMEILKTLSLLNVRDCLCIPDYKYDSIKFEYHTDQERLAELIKYWIFNDPWASWRKLIQRLDQRNESDIADRIRKYAEKLTG